MNIVTLSPVASEPLSPMITSVTPVTPTLEPDDSTSTAAVNSAPLLDLGHQSYDGDSSLNAGASMSRDSSRR